MTHLAKIIGILACLISGLVIAQTQTIISDRYHIIASSNSSLTIPINYNSDDNTLTGLGIRVHFNHDILQFQNTTNRLSTDLTNFDASAVTESIGLTDNNSDTTHFINVAWTNIGGNWPNQVLPIKLFDIHFLPSSTFIGTNTIIRFIRSSGPGNFYATPVIVSNIPNIATGDGQTIVAGDNSQSFSVSYGINNSGIQVTFSAPNGAVFSNNSNTETVTTNSNGIATSSALVDTVLGDNKQIQVISNGFATQTLSYSVVAGIVSVPQSSVSNNSNISINESSITFLVILKDQFNNNIIVNPASFNLGGNVLSPSWTLEEFTGSQATLTYIPQSIGAETLSINYDNVLLATRTIIVSAGAIEPASTTFIRVGGGSVSADSSVTFDIVFRDRLGNQVSDSSGVSLVATGVASYATVSFVNNNDGTALATYQAISQGVGGDSFSISVNGQAIGQSRVATIVAGGIHAGQSDVINLNNLNTDADDTPTRFLVRLDDQFNNDIAVNPNLFSLTGLVLGSSWMVSSYSDDSATLTYIPRLVGTDNLVITYNEVQLATRQVVVSAGGVDASQSSVSGSASQSTNADTPISFAVVLDDQFGNNITAVSGDFSLTGDTLGNWGNSQVSGNLATLTYTPQTVGTDNLIISYNSVQLATRQVVVSVGNVNVSQSDVSGNASQSTNADTPISFLITLDDQFGNYITAVSGNFALSGANLTGSAFVVSSVASNRATLTYTPQTVGTDTLVITYNGVQLATREIVVSHGALDSITLSAGKTTLLANSSDNTTLTASLFDQYNNTITTSQNISFTDNDSSDATVTLTGSTQSNPQGQATATISSANSEAEGNVIITVISGSVSASVTVNTQNFGFSVRPSYLINGDSVNLAIVGDGDNNANWSLAGVGSLSNNAGNTNIFTTNGVGVATITVSDTVAGLSVTDTIVITINAPLSNNISGDIAMILNSSRTITITGGGSERGFISSNPSIISIDSNGVITANALGTATITASDTINYDGQLVNEITTGIIYVVEQLQSDGTIYLDTQTETTRTIIISGGRENNLSYTSQNPNIATVSSDGIMSAVSSGRTTIMVRDSQFNNITTVFTVVVSEPLALRDRNNNALDINALNSGQRLRFKLSGGTGDYSAHITGGELSNETLTLNSRGEFVFRVAQTGAFSGVYTISVVDNTDTTLSQTYQFRVPLYTRLSRPAILSGSNNSELSSAVLEVFGAGSGSTLTLSATNLINFANQTITATPLGNHIIASTTISGSLVNQALTVLISISHTITGLSEAQINLRLLVASQYTGTVVETDGSTPVSGADVIISQGRRTLNTTKTGSDGRFSFIVPVGNNYQITINNPTHDLVRQSANNYLNNNYDTIALAQTGYIVSGMVITTGLVSYDLYARRVARGGAVFGPFSQTTSNYQLRLVPGVYDIYTDNVMSASETFRGSTRITIGATNVIAPTITLRARPTLRYQAIRDASNNIVFSERSNANVSSHDVVNARVSFTNSIISTGNKRASAITITLGEAGVANIDITQDAPLLLKNASNAVVFVYQHIGETSTETISVYTDRQKVPDDKIGGTEVVDTDGGFEVIFDQARNAEEVDREASVERLSITLPPRPFNVNNLRREGDTTGINQEATITNAFVVLTPVNLATETNTVAIGSGGTFYQLDIRVEAQTSSGTETLDANKALNDDAEIVIRMSYDTDLISVQDWGNGTYVVYHANTLDDVESGNYIEQISGSAITVYEYSGEIEFTIRSLSGLTIGGVISDNTNTVSFNGGGGCTLYQNGQKDFSLLLLLLLLSMIYLIRRRYL